jgi:hypothetical protein
MAQFVLSIDSLIFAARDSLPLNYSLSLSDLSIFLPKYLHYFAITIHGMIPVR